ncbi:hypothetical protein [Photobacterium leiognathi]|uniref:hypothetical protein n=1 Tax=Photobacterium leiognathi TaxID=553611 RepID=UPI00387E72B4
MPWFLVGDDHGYDGRDESAHGDRDVNANGHDRGAMLLVKCNERDDARHLDGDSDDGSQQAVHCSLVELGYDHDDVHYDDARGGGHVHGDYARGDRDDDPRVRHLLLGYLRSHIHYTLLNLNILNH